MQTYNELISVGEHGFECNLEITCTSEFFNDAKIARVTCLKNQKASAKLGE